MPTITKPITPRVASAGGTPATTTTKRAPSASASKGRREATPLSATKPASRGASPVAAAPTKKPIINAAKGSTSTTKKGAQKAGSPTSPSKKRAPSKSKKGEHEKSVASEAEGTKKKKSKPSAIGNFYVPAHNLSFGSDPRKPKAKSVASDVDTSAISDVRLSEASPSQGNVNTSFGDPASLFTMSASRAAAQHERERADQHATVDTPKEASPEVVGTGSFGAEVNGTSATALPAMPQFQSYFFGVKSEAPHSPARAANEAEAAAATEEAAKAADGTATQPDEGISREASPQPQAPKLVSFDKELSAAEANQAALVEGSDSASPAGSPVPKRRADSSKSPASPTGKRVKKAGSVASSVKSKSKSSKSKSRAKSKSSEHVEDKPPGPIQRLFGDIAKSGLTGAPTLASLAIAARRTGSEVDLKAAAAASALHSNSGTVIDTSVSAKQTANALFNLGWMLFYGMGGCVVNYKKSYAYFYDAATKYDHPMAYYYLGLQLRDGKGVEKNLLASHDAFQTSMALVGSDNVSEFVSKEAANPEAATNIKTIIFPAEKDRTNLESTTEGAPETTPVTVINESHKQSFVHKGDQTLHFDGIDRSDVETIANWQIGKLWAAGNVVVLEEAPSQKKEKKTDEAAAGDDGAVAASRAASPHPATPRQTATASTARGPSVGLGKAPSATNQSSKHKAASTAATTKRAASPKRAGSPKKKGKKSTKADATNNTGGGPLVAIKPFSAATSNVAAAGMETSVNHNDSTSATVKASHANKPIHFRKVRYGVDKPTAIAYFNRSSVNGFEHAAMAAVILRDDPIPRAELDD